MRRRVIGTSITDFSCGLRVFSGFAQTPSLLSVTTAVSLGNGERGRGPPARKLVPDDHMMRHVQPIVVIFRPRLFERARRRLFWPMNVSGQARAH